jgi:ketosteroid isomerase-like protein
MSLTQQEEKYLQLAKKAWSYYDKEASERDYTDYEPFNDLLHDDVVFKVACSPKTPVWNTEWRGKEAVMGMNANADPVTIVGYFELLEPIDWFVKGTRVVKIGKGRWQLQNKDGDIVTIDNDFAHVVDFKDEKIIRILAIEDLSEWNLAFR